jgi:hypothetical protein
MVCYIGAGLMTSSQGKMAEQVPFPIRNKWLVTYFLVAVECFNIFWSVSQPFSILRYVNAISLPAGLSVGWRYGRGNFTGWIPYWFGTTIQLSRGSERIAEFANDEEIDKGIAEWLRLSGVRWYERTGTLNYQFLRKKDAVQFKLTWA